MSGVEPITDLDAIWAIRDLLEDNPRDRCLFEFGINTAMRVSEILVVRVEDVRDVKAGENRLFEKRKSKRFPHRRITLNEDLVDSIQAWVAVLDERDQSDGPLFPSRKKPDVSITERQVWHLWKTWTKEVGLEGRYGTHTGRKTWARHQFEKGESVYVLMKALGHERPEQTLEYMCVQDADVERVYARPLYERPEKPKKKKTKPRMTKEEKMILEAAKAILEKYED